MATMQLYSMNLSVDLCDKLSLIAQHSIKLREVMTPAVAFMVRDTYMMMVLKGYECRHQL